MILAGMDPRPIEGTALVLSSVIFSVTQFGFVWAGLRNGVYSVFNLQISKAANFAWFQAISLISILSILFALFLAFLGVVTILGN